MEKDLIIKYIAKEIRYHDCIIVPDFGGFIGSYESAYYDQSQGKYFPPSKALIFNTALKNNDGLLATLIKDGEGISYVSAIAIIENTLNVWKEEIENGNRIEIEDMGYIYKTKLGHIQFYQNKAINLYPGSFGLSAVVSNGIAIQKEITESTVALETVEVPKTEPQLKPVKQIDIEAKKAVPIIGFNKDEKIEEEAIEDTDSEEIVHPASRKFTIKKKYLVAASFIPFLFYSYWIPAKTDFLKTGKIQVSDFNPLMTPSISKYAPRNSFLTEYEEEVFTPVDDYLKTLPEDTKAFSYPFDEDYYIPVSLNGQKVSIQKKSIEEKPIKEVKAIEPKQVSNGNYHIIAGCFGEKANAEKLVRSIKKKGYDASILDYHKGLHRVTAQSFNSKTEALNSRKSLKADGVSGWILKK
jgi:hypothetical protein